MTTPALKLERQVFDKLYPVRVQQKFVDSGEDLQRRGYFSTGYRSFDRGLMSNWVSVLLRITSEDDNARTLLAVVEDGGSFQASNDTMFNIYEAVLDYIVEVERQCAVMMVKPPADDLRRLSRLTTYIYDEVVSRRVNPEQVRLLTRLKEKPITAILGGVFSHSHLEQELLSPKTTPKPVDSSVTNGFSTYRIP